MGYSFRLAESFFFNKHHPTDRIAHTSAFVTPVVEHWLEREIAQWANWMEGSVLFNDALTTFYLRLYGVRHMVKDHSDSVRYMVSR